jgi:hypothetical protein
MLSTPHRFSRTLIVGERSFKLLVEISEGTGAVYEGSIFENGNVIHSATAPPADDADRMKSGLLAEVSAITGAELQDASIGEWIYEELNLDGSPAVR